MPQVISYEENFVCSNRGIKKKTKNKRRRRKKKKSVLLMPETSLQDPVIYLFCLFFMKNNKMFRIKFEWFFYSLQNMVM